jgi:hypothetical protein
MMQLTQAITSVFEAIVYPSMVVLAVMLVIGALELRSRIRRPEADDRISSHDRDSRRRSNRVAPAAR